MEGFTNNTLPNSFDFKDNSIVRSENKIFFIAIAFWRNHNNAKPLAPSLFFKERDVVFHEDFAAQY
jgi:hypothetical protein